MKSFLLALFSIAALFVHRLRTSTLCTPNSESPAGIHEMGIATKLADGAFPSRYLFVMPGSDSDHVTLCNAATPPSGYTDDQPAEDEDPVNVGYLGAFKGTRKVVATGALNPEVGIYVAANGQVQALPNVAGTYYRVGRTKIATQQSADGLFLVEAALHAPQKVVVIAAFTSATIANASDLPSAETLANAIKADLNSLAVALAAPAEVMVI